MKTIVFGNFDTLTIFRSPDLHQIIVVIYL